MANRLQLGGEEMGHGHDEQVPGKGQGSQQCGLLVGDEDGQPHDAQDQIGRGGRAIDIVQGGELHKHQHEQQGITGRLAPPGHAAEGAEGEHGQHTAEAEQSGQGQAMDGCVGEHARQVARAAAQA